MALRKIRWKEADYKRLHNAVNKFNRTLRKSINDSDLPLELKDYKEVKHQIHTRKGLNDTIDSLERLTKESASNKVELESGLTVSEYQWNEVERANKINRRRWKKELRELSVPKQGETYSRVQMGTETSRRLQENLRENRLDVLQQAQYPSDFLTIEQGIMNKASEDKRYLQALRYKENYMELLKERYSNFAGYEDLYNKVKDMTPQRFYEFMKADELTEDLTYQSDQIYDQSEFNGYLLRLGVKSMKFGDYEVVQSEEIDIT